MDLKVELFEYPPPRGREMRYYLNGLPVSKEVFEFLVNELADKKKREAK